MKTIIRLLSSSGPSSGVSSHFPPKYGTYVVEIPHFFFGDRRNIYCISTKARIFMQILSKIFGSNFRAKIDENIQNLQKIRDSLSSQLLEVPGSFSMRLVKLVRSTSQRVMIGYGHILECE